MSRFMLRNVYGAHRVVAPRGALPQAAARLNADNPCGPYEMQIAVDWLNVDATSFRQIAESHDHDPDRISRFILDLVRRAGKLHNPVTNSGGMLIGTVEAVGSNFPNAPAIGARIASLASLTLTPLRLHGISEVDLEDCRFRVAGTAFLFASSPWAALPPDLPEPVALAALDVAGAAPRTRLRTPPGGRVIVLGGGGRSGLLSCLAAREAGASSIVAVDLHEVALDRARALGAATQVVHADATDPFALVQKIGPPADLTVSCVNVEQAEAGAILCTKPQGWVLFFSMATSFQRAALTAEGLGSPVTLEVGNGFVAGHAEETTGLVRRYSLLVDLFA